MTCALLAFIVGGGVRMGAAPKQPRLKPFLSPPPSVCLGWANPARSGPMHGCGQVRMAKDVRRAKAKCGKMGPKLVKLGRTMLYHDYFCALVDAGPRQAEWQPDIDKGTG